MGKNSKGKNLGDPKRRKEHSQRHPQTLRNWQHPYQRNSQLLLSGSFYLSFLDRLTYHTNKIFGAECHPRNPKKTILRHILQHQRLYKSENQLNKIKQLPQLRREVRRRR